MSDFMIENGILTGYRGAGGAVTVPDGVTVIGERAFAHRVSITCVTLPAGITQIGQMAFKGCAGLEEIVIPAGVHTLADYAFLGCIALTRVTLPASLHTLGNGVFSGCRALADVTLPHGLQALGCGVMQYCKSLTAVRIPDAVREMPDRAFLGCSALADVKFPVGLTAIGIDAFALCHALTRVTLPAGLERIGRTAFFGCSTLRELHVPATVTRIGERAFTGNDSLHLCIHIDSIRQLSMQDKAHAVLGYFACHDRFPFTEADAAYYTRFFKRQRSVMLPTLCTDPAALRGYLQLGLLTAADYDAFVAAAAPLKNVELNAMLLAWSSDHAAALAQARARAFTRALRADPNSLTERRKLWAWKKLTEDTCAIVDYKGADPRIEIPATIGKMRVVEIKGAALARGKQGRGTERKHFFGATLSAVTISEGIKCIGMGAFEGCSALSEVTLPNSLTVIDAFAFEGCVRLKDLRIPSSVTEIGSFAFAGCAQLTDLHIPPTVTKLGTLVFEECGALTIHGKAGSAVEKCAKESGVKFVAI